MKTFLKLAMMFIAILISFTFLSSCGSDPVVINNSDQKIDNPRHDDYDDDDYDDDDDDDVIDDGDDPYDSGRRGSVASSYASGNGTSSSPYIIKTAAQLRRMADEVNSGLHTTSHFRLEADIVINENVLKSNGELNTSKKYERWIPIGSTTKGKRFSGVFDGNGHTIRGLVINGGYKYVGLFGSLEGATITDLRVSDSFFAGESAVKLGGIVSYTGSWGSEVVIRRCSVNVLFGKNTGTTLSRIGGILGDGHFKVIEDCCANYKNTFVSYYVGGIASEGCGNIRNCTTNVSIQAQYAGGIVGSARPKGIENCVARCIVLNTPRYAGGLAGIAGLNDVLQNSYWLNDTQILPAFGGDSNKVTITGCDGLTEAEMKASSFITTLNNNKNRISSSLSSWEKGPDGFPMLSCFK